MRRKEFRFVECRRFFFSVTKETAWLNEMGAQGYRLESRKDHKYRFAHTENRVWHYRVEWMDNAADSEQMQSYLDGREAQGAAIAAVWSLWVYFVSEGPIPANEEMLRRNVKHYRNIALFAGILMLAAIALFIDQLSQRAVLEEHGLKITAPTFDSSEQPIVWFCRRLVYGAQVLLYYYSKLWSRVFGNTRATTVLGILIPVILLLGVIAVKNAIEAHKCRARVKEFGNLLADQRKEEEALEIAEQEVHEENL